MLASHALANPFALMMDPAAVLQAVERSERLAGLQSRICRPLDKPLIPKADGETEVDAADDEPAPDETAAT